jgi:arylesterase/paraoxonase
MDRLRRAFYLLIASLAVTAIMLVFRVLTATGIFTEVDHQFGGTCQVVTGPAGVEDLQIDRTDGLLFASAAGGQGGLFSLPLGHAERGFARLAGTPSNFHPSGLGFFRTQDGNLVLMTVDRPDGGDPAIEIFDARISNGNVSLSQRASVAGGLLVNPIDVAVAGPDQFYVSNASTSTSALGRMLESFDLVARGNVVYFDGNVFRVVANGLGSARGIALSPDGAHLYVATALGRSLVAFERNLLSGSLKQSGSLVIESGLDQINGDESGNLWVAAHPRLMTWRGKDRSGRTPSQVFRVLLSGGSPSTAELVYADPGSAISGASAAAANGQQLFITSPRDRKVLACRFGT